MLERNIGLIECYLDSMVKAALLGKIKDAAVINVGEQLFQCSTTKIIYRERLQYLDILKAYV